METKELKITPPEGFEIDKENSTFECIKFKPIVKRWRDTNPKVDGFYLAGNNVKYYPHYTWDFGNHNLFATEKQAKAALAMAQISQIMANDERFGGVVSSAEFENDNVWKYSLYRSRNKIAFYRGVYGFDHFLSFHTPEQRDLFLEENEDLVKDYLMVD